MEDRYQHTIDGQEVNEGDINLVATEASLADDRTLAELFRLAQVGTTNPGGVLIDRGIVGGDPVSAIVVPSGSADARVSIAAFRAFVGAVLPGDSVAARKNIRSGFSGTTTMQFPAITTNPRWDLIYARVDVDVDAASVSRFVKTGTTPATQQSIVTTKQTTVTIGRVQGTESSSATFPAIPADSGSSYYIPIAYVLLLAGHTLTTAIAKTNICESAYMLRVSPGTGGAHCKPASINSRVGLSGAQLASTWTSSGRNHAFIPPTMVGKVEKLIALEFGATRTAGLGVTTVVDDTIDWRNRLFKTTVFVGSISGSSYTLAWNSGGTAFAPDGRLPSAATGGPVVAMGQSFHQDAGAAGGEVALLIAATVPQLAASSSVELYVDMTTGKLMVKVSATDPSAEIVFWLEATGQHNNAF